MALPAKLDRLLSRAEELRHELGTADGSRFGTLSKELAELEPVVEKVQALRRAGIAAEMAYKGNVKRRMERANRAGARAAVILGDTELAEGVVQLRDLDAGTQETVPLAEVPGRLA